MGFIGILVWSGCSTYVTEPVDVVFGCDWSCAVCNGGPLLCMYGVVVVVCAGGIIYMLLLMVVVEYSRVVTLCACIIVWSGCDYFQCDREIRFMCDAGQCGIIIDIYVM